ncbi:type II toxin-antitoxin system HipA family toxin [Persephonella sp.]
MKVKAYRGNKQIGTLYKDQNDHVFMYGENVELPESISLSMPATKKFYIEKYDLHPYFKMFIPEGYLFEVVKNYLSKRLNRKINDYDIFTFLAPNIEGRITFESQYEKKGSLKLTLEEILENDTGDFFGLLVQKFLQKSSITGVQKKIVVEAENGNEGLDRAEYIIKTWGDEFPHLAENEYFCMKALKKAGLEIPEIHLSKNKKFLVVKKFNRRPDGTYLGFEEAIVLLGRKEKYEGSYEQVAKLINKITDEKHKTKSLKSLFTLIVMNYLLKNGDAHLRNFGVLYETDMTGIRLSPAYDVVNTMVYIKDDIPALTLEGRKIWHSRETLIRFGDRYCRVEEKAGQEIFDRCINAVEETIRDIKQYIQENPSFREIGERMTKILDWSLKNTDRYIKKSRLLTEEDL